MFFFLFSLSLISSNVHCLNGDTNNLTNIRTSYKTGTQRIVLDITGETEPPYYLKKEQNILYVTIEANIPMEKIFAFKKTLENTNNIKSIQFLRLPEENESTLIINLKSRTSEEIMSLPNPSRVVLDINKEETGD